MITPEHIIVNAHEDTDRKKMEKTWHNLKETVTSLSLMLP
ncbi:unnamed protein product [Brassica rapa]|uniref:Uncharacterized protein n=2 Tax=Brassica TaxID=3705 RepID=A0A8D9DIT1_BRACM|nr:unnamed protein product [Brassica napus]CAG7874632.1 unnamed protein product [Brassica rapa]CDY17239.1 BnaA05g09490D [Brassica napus]